MRPSGTPHELEDRRLRALRLLDEGFAPVEVARQIGVDRRSVRRWKAAARKGGAKAVAAKPASGRPRRLSVRDLTRLRRMLMKGAQAAGLPTDLWTCPRVSWLIQRQFGIQYHPAHVSRVLHGLGFSPQKPTRRALERDEERIQAWIEQDWPRVKKRRAPEAVSA
jgi:transposase